MDDTIDQRRRLHDEPTTEAGTRPRPVVTFTDTSRARRGSGQAPLLSWADGRLLRAGRPHQMFSGSTHYFRVHPEQWHDRLLRLLDLGLNTVDTYVPWNFHRPRADRPADFAGWRDVASFVDVAADLGLDVVLRPGPYICAEWSNGGLPAWVTGTGTPLRTAASSFLSPVEEWFDELLPRLAPLQARAGGPVVAFQVENEFGSYGDDSPYLDWIVGQLRGHDLTELLYTADGPTEVMLDGGSVPGILTTVTLGSKPEAARAMLRSRRAGEPFVAAEFWSGWFDHWGQPHHVRDAVNAAATLEGIVADGGSVSIYMAHGGTNFGLWSGANDVDGELRPTVTSYDSDAPIAEDGRLVDKFWAMRSVLGAGGRAIRSAPPQFLPRASVPLVAGAALADVLAAVAGPVVRDGRPAPTFEALGLDSGLVSYTARVVLPDEEVSLTLSGVADRAIVSVDGEVVGTVQGSGSIVVRGRGETSSLEVLVENLGRVNYGPRLGEPKGLLGTVSVGRRAVQVWDAAPIDLEGLDVAELCDLVGAPPSDAEQGPSGAGVARVVVQVDEPLDAHLALPGSTKGYVWLNGLLLGRYWNVGPQQTLYAPAPAWREGANEVVVFELHQLGTALEIRDEPELGPPEQYIEEF